MNTPAPVPKPTINSEKKDIKYIQEYELNFDNIIYLLKIGKIVNEIEELIFFVEIKNSIEVLYYQIIFSLENLQKMNKIFRQFDTIDEIIDTLKEIISDKNIIIKKENDELLIKFKFKKLGKGEEEIIFKLEKNNLENGKIIENLISNINNLKLEIKNLTTNINNLKLEIYKLKNENDSKKIIKYQPVLENGWINDPWIPHEFFVFKNNDQVSFQGVVVGDWSKKIFTLPPEFRTKYRLCFPVLAAQAFNRVDILTNGDVYMSSHASLGINGNGWVNFSGITYNIIK